MTAGNRRSAVIAGASGLVGSELLQLLAKVPDYARVVALARRPLPPISERIERAEARFDALPSVLAAIPAGADVYCCLGSTIRAAGSPTAFRTVDHDYVRALAQWARSSGARRFLLISALGADPHSRVFYNRVKGEAERSVRAVGPESVVVLRPSLLDGARAQARFGERIALSLSRPLRGLIPRMWRPVHARDVAAAMLEAARDSAPAAVIESAAMLGAADRIAGAA